MVKIKAIKDGKILLAYELPLKSMTLKSIQDRFQYEFEKKFGKNIKVEVS